MEVFKFSGVDDEAGGVLLGQAMAKASIPMSDEFATLLGEAGEKLDAAFGTFYLGDKQYNPIDFHGCITVTKVIEKLTCTLSLDYNQHPGTLSLLVTA